MNAQGKQTTAFRIAGVLVIIAAALGVFSSTRNHASADATITIDGASPGRSFDGIGALSAGASSALLIQYPEPQRSQILDYLFTPYYGASLQMLKVEIGGDMNATAGAEPSYEHSAGVANYTHGYEWWLMEQAKARNPNIQIWGLEWGAPSWLGGICTAANAQYVANWVRGAQTVHHVAVDYVGVWNETSCGSAQDGYIKTLRHTLDDNGVPGTKIIAPDLFDWNLTTAMQSDPILASAVYAVGIHYPKTASTAQARGSGFRLWSSEDGPWNSSAFSGGYGHKSIAQTLNQNYVNGKMTATTIWALVSAYYPTLSLPNAGLMTAEEPWSGHYSVDPAIWAVAHTTQFTHIGWRYLDTSSAMLAGGGSIATLRASDSGDWSAVIETTGARSSQALNFQVSGGLASQVIHVWQSTPNAYFYHASDIMPTNGSFRITVQPGVLYTLTTTTGQQKGTITGTIPAATAFPVAYSDNFEAYTLGETNPRYLQPQNGAYEVQNCAGGRAGQCLAQVVTATPTRWPSAGGDPVNLLGDPHWTNYSVSTDVLLAGSGFAQITGHLAAYLQNGGVEGYQLYIFANGTWRLLKGPNQTQLATGTVPIKMDTWHTLKLTFNGTSITASIDAAQVAYVTDADYRAGMAAIGTGWNTAQFDNLAIAAIPPLGSLAVSVSLGQEIRNDYSNAVGMQITIGPAPIVVSELGRYVAAGNVQTHTLTIVRASDLSAVARTSLALAGNTPDSLGFAYAALSVPVTLSAHTTYYIVSSEVRGGDQWYGRSPGAMPNLFATGAATIDHAIYFDGATWLNDKSGQGDAYGPVNFKYNLIDDAIQGAGSDQFHYSGTWFHCVGTCQAPIANIFDNSASWSNTPNDTFMIAFAGTGIALYGVADAHHGIGGVAICDGSGQNCGAETPADFYGPTRVGSTLVYASAVLSSGNHVLRVRVTGAKDAASRGTYIVPDFVAITP